MEKEDFERIQGDIPRVTKLGETAVLLKLTELGWDAFNLNAENPNYKGVDIACIHPKTHRSCMFLQAPRRCRYSPPSRSPARP